MATIHDFKLELVPYPPYSPDLAPSDFHLFPQMKKVLTDRHFASDDDIVAAVKEFLKSRTRVFLHWIKSASAPLEQVFSPGRGLC